MFAYYFNYSHELALADKGINYVAPSIVRTMERDLMSLAAFFAVEGDVVVVSEGMVERCSAFYAGLCPGVRFVTLSSVPAESVFRPWGLNADLCRKLRKTDTFPVPTDVEVNDLRLLASRRTAVDILERLRKELSYLPLCGESRYCIDMDDAAEAVAAFPRTVLKAPWSSSGRGLRFADGSLQPPLSGWCRRIITKQGGIVVEPYYEKVYDFAAEMSVSPAGEVHYTGLSHFLTSDKHTYLGNTVTSQENMRHALFHNFDERVFTLAVSHLERVLAQKIAGRYTGPLGVDMMLCRQNEELFLHPCVEINMRNTMGWLALLLERLIAPGTQAVFKIRYDTDTEALRLFLKQIAAPIFDSKGRLLSGHRLLTPLLADTHYVAWIEISPAGVKEEQS